MDLRQMSMLSWVRAGSAGDTKGDTTRINQIQNTKTKPFYFGCLETNIKSSKISSICFL
ncbi:BnaC05g46650D [Brassica napus]|uniref:(rape) hypothetical protein n=1 Tax=Brassica napus TaxID=3708 RepID=A0A078HX33_BRANA|nr:unnamed protein product [Brassica napus]CDY41939.1 BnaC05g46650D [Brassica napus]